MGLISNGWGLLLAFAVVVLLLGVFTAEGKGVVVGCVGGVIAGVVVGAVPREVPAPPLIL